MASSKLSVIDFTNAVEPLLKTLDESLNSLEPGKPHSSIHLSDVRDKLNRQYVDLVQEGGGVHGIALAGYTYILEKKGVSFMKMAGTSAGSINTMLLSGVVTKEELKALKATASSAASAQAGWDPNLRYDPTTLNEDDYYDTRSEKLVELLAKKDLTDLVDGHKSWRKVLLTVFKGKVDFGVVKSYFFKIGKWGLLFALFNLLLIIFSVFLVIDLLSNIDSSIKWVVGPVAVILLIAFIFLIAQAIYMRLLYKRSARFGINKGDDFETWVANKLAESKVSNVSHLKSKLQLERLSLQPAYAPPANKEKRVFPAGDDWYKQLEEISKDIDCYQHPTSGKQDEFDKCAASLKLINFKLMALARSLPDDGDKAIRASDLLSLFYPVIEKEQALQVFSTGEDIKTSLDKEIAIVCADITSGMKVEFPAMHKAYWGDNFKISPACYVRASMSVPLFFKPYAVSLPTEDKDIAIVKNERKALLKTDRQQKGQQPASLLVDGGLLSNFPVNIFYNPDVPIPTKPTLGVKLEFESQAKVKEVKSIAGFLGELVSTMRYFYDRDFISRHAMFNKTVRSIDTGKVHWLNFDLTDEDQVELFFRGALTATIFLLQSHKSSNFKAHVDKLIKLGENVKVGKSFMNIYKNIEGATFQTEDIGTADVFFNWEAYKLERLNFLSEERLRTAKLKRNASYADKPSKLEDEIGND